MKHINNSLKILLFLTCFYSTALAEEKKAIVNDHEWNFYSGIFDFSDDGKRASLFGIQHQNENLSRESFLGTLSPVTGFMITADSATYAYTGIQAQYKIGKLNIIPSFTPGLYGCLLYTSPSPRD